ncbi:MAG: type II toxin-antitoxin system Phd/YefM family antitoxin [Chloroflexota bacterium]
MVTVPIEDLRERLSEYLKDFQNGEGLVVTEDGHAIARIVPATEEEPPISDGLRQMVAEGRASWSGKRPKLPETRIKLRGPGPTLADIVIENRG